MSLRSTATHACSSRRSPSCALPRPARCVMPVRPERRSAMRILLVADAESPHTRRWASAPADVLWLPFRPGWHRDLTTSALVNASLITYDSEDVGSLLCAYAPRTPRRRVVFGPERAWASARRHEQPIVLSARRPESFYNVESV